ncbi:hypothetical protein BN135_3265 [Cronobacter muytjensii 530]
MKIGAIFQNRYFSLSLSVNLRIFGKNIVSYGLAAGLC